LLFDFGLIIMMKMRIKRRKTKFDKPINMDGSITKYSATVNIQKFFSYGWISILFCMKQFQAVVGC